MNERGSFARAVVTPRSYASRLRRVLKIPLKELASTADSRSDVDSVLNQIGERCKLTASQRLLRP